MRYFTLFVLFAFIHNLTKAQEICGSSTPLDSIILKNEERISKIKLASKKLRSTSTSTQFLPIYVHVVRKTDGSGGITIDDINAGISKLNFYFYYSGVQFYSATPLPHYIDSDTYYDFDTSEENSLCSTNDVNNAINLYITGTVSSNGNSVSGYAYFPSVISESNRVFIKMNNFNDNRTTAHEFGHYFNLLHTFQNNNNADISKRELVTRGTGSNCQTMGDLLCDTPADPYLLPGATTSGCTYNGTPTDANGQLFTPSLANMMSYYVGCGNEFTTGQYLRLSDGYLLRVDNNNQYTLNASATGGSVPSGLVATRTASGVSISFTDNSSSEFGYIIEKHDDSNTDFVPIKGLTPNTTTFVDTDITSNKIYSYRVRATNATTYSNVDTAYVQLSYCTPVYSSACSPAIIADFTLTGTGISKINSGCGVNSYSNFTSMVGNVTTGSSYSFTARALTAGAIGTYYPQHLSIWIDFNQDGTFDNVTERVFQSTSTSYMNSSLTGSITISSNASSGNTRMRVRSQYSASGLVNDPCITYTFGEAEDYTLNITNNNTITTGVVSPSSACPNTPISVSFTKSNFTPQSYLVQVAEVGSSTFSSISTIGTTSPLTAYIPSSLAGNKNYQVRIISQSPQIIGTISASNLYVSSLPSAPTFVFPNPSICNGETISLSVSNCTNGTITWSTGATGASINVSPNITTDYTANCTSNGCTSLNSTITVTVLPKPSAPNLSASNNPICFGQSTNLSATNCAGTINWSNGSSNSSITVSPNNTSIYSATCTSNSCVSNSSSITINVNSIPSAPSLSSTKTTLCLGDTTSINGSNCVGGTITWSNGSTSNSISVSPSISTTYTATCTINACVSNSASITIIVNAKPNAPTLSSTINPICSGNSSTLSATNCAGIINWSNGSSGNTITVSPSVTTSYTATCTVNSCISNVAPISLVVNAKPSLPNISSTKNSICIGDSSTLSISNCGGIITWSNGSNNSSLLVKPLVNTSYKAICTINGCNSDSSSISIEVKTKAPTPLISATNNLLCIGQSTTLSVANCSGSVAWSNNQIANTISVSPTSSTTFKAICSIANFCVSDSASESIIVSPIPNKPIITIDTTIVCGGDSATLSCNNCNGTLVWSTGQSTTSIKVAPTQTTLYSAVCKINNCISDSSIVAIEFKSLQISSSKSSICAGDSSLLHVSDCLGRVTWSHGDSTASIYVKPLSNTSYTAYCLVGNCISDSIKTTIQVLPKPLIPTLSATNNSICNGSSTNISASNCSYDIVWNNGQSSSSIVVSPTITSSYWAVCKNANCVSDTARISIFVSEKPTKPTLSAQKTTICQGESIKIFSSNCTSNTIWSDNTMLDTLSISPSVSKTYSAICVSNNCSSDTSYININVIPKSPTPLISATNNLLCVGQSTTLSVANCSGSVAWSNNQIANTISVSPTSSTTFKAVCSIANFCVSDSASESIIVSPIPNKPIITIDSVIVCRGDSTTLSCNNCNGTLIWSTGQSTTSIKVAPTQSTGYSALCKINNCYSDTTYISILFKQLQLSISKPIICEGDSSLLQVSNCDGKVVWSHGDSTASIYVKPLSNTSYTAYCLVGNCIPDSIKTTIQVLPKPLMPTLSANKTSICMGDSIMLLASNCNDILRWSTGDSTNNITIKPLVSQTYWAICKNQICISDSAKINITVNTKPAKPSIQTNKPLICLGDSTQLTSSCIDSVLWSSGEKTTSIFVKPNEPTNYWNVCKLGNCVSDTAKINIGIYNQLHPILTATRNSICMGDTVSISSDISICTNKTIWSTGDTTAILKVQALNTTEYWAICAFDGCISDTSKITIQITNQLQAPLLSASKNTICLGESVNISSNSCTGALFWQSGIKADMITVSPVQNSTYKAYCKSGNCISDTATINIQVFPIPNAPTLVAEKDSICFPSSTHIFSTNCAGTTIWQNGYQGDTISVSSPYPTEYKAVCSLNGCISDTARITIFSSIYTIVDATIKGPSVIASGSVAQVIVTLKDGLKPWSYTLSNGISRANLHNSSDTLYLTITHDTLITISYVATLCSGNNNVDSLKISVLKNLPNHFNLKVMMEGPYNASTLTMKTTLNQRGLLPGQIPIGTSAIATPAGQPYSISPWLYAGTENVTNYAIDVVDWILISLRSNASVSSTVWRGAALLKSNGLVVFPDSTLLPTYSENSSFYIAIEHRNHLGILSHIPINLSNNTFNYDFSTQNSYTQTTITSNGQKQIGTVFVMYACDGIKTPQNQNFDINIKELTQWKVDNGYFDRYLLDDFNLDAEINFLDRGLFKQNNGIFSMINQ